MVQPFQQLHAQVVCYSPDSDSYGVLTSSLGRGACEHFGAWVLVPLQIAARCGCVRFGAWVLVPLPAAGSAARCVAVCAWVLVCR